MTLGNASLSSSSLFPSNSGAKMSTQRRFHLVLQGWKRSHCQRASPTEAKTMGIVAVAFLEALTPLIDPQ